MRLIRFLPNASWVQTYEQYVQFVLNIPYLEIMSILTIRQAILLSRRGSRIPDEWIDYLSENEEDRLQWKYQEFREELE